MHNRLPLHTISCPTDSRKVQGTNATCNTSVTSNQASAATLFNVQLSLTSGLLLYTKSSWLLSRPRDRRTDETVHSWQNEVPEYDYPSETGHWENTLWIEPEPVQYTIRLHFIGSNYSDSVNWKLCSLNAVSFMGYLYIILHFPSANAKWDVFTMDRDAEIVF